tara:strand:+ start:3807 stop:4574 length:768 start_codon:yes stop_codon:yes gene_type:complete
MKLIIEGWRGYLSELKRAEDEQQVGPIYDNVALLVALSNIDQIDEASWKKGLAGLGLATALGVGGGAGIGSAITSHDGTSKAPQVHQDVGGLTDMPTFGKNDKAGDEMPIDKNWTRSPTRGEYVWVSPDQFEGGFVLPLGNVTVDDYREYLSAWNIDDLYKLLYGSSGQWSYTKEAPNLPKTFDNHPGSGLEMLPPDWSIAFDVYKEKVEGATEHIQDRISDAEDGGLSIAKGLGHEDVESLLQDLQKLNRSVEY